MNYPSHYTSFLGGEVSPLFWHRCDMEKFSRWLATAENIRFHNIGAFYNRAGFERMGPTLFSERNPVVKLIPFIFNNNDVFEIEFTNGKFRVRKDGKVVVREDGSEVSYDSPIKIENIQQLKYAQSGDIIFIASGTNPLYELRRIKEDGTEWELKKFDADIMPVGDKNKDKENTANITKIKEEDLGNKIIFNLPNPIFEGNKYGEFDINLVKNDESIITLHCESSDLQGIVSQINSYQAFGEAGLVAEYEASTRALIFIGSGEALLSKNINFKMPVLEETRSDAISPYKIEPYPGKETVLSNFYFKINNPGNGWLPVYFTFFNGYGWVPYGPYTVSTFKEFAGKLASTEQTVNTKYVENGDYIDFVVRSWRDYAQEHTAYVSFKRITTEGVKEYSGSFKGGYPVGTFEAKGLFLKNIKEGDVFSIENEVNIQEVKNTMGEKSSWQSEPILTNGKWRVVTTGNWSGWVKLEYSIDNQTTWTVFERAGSGNDSQPININKSGEIEHDDLLYIRASAYVDTIDGADEWNRLSISLYAENFTVNSYYKVISKLSDTEAYVECIKNDVGNIVDNYKWRLPVFSEKEGYPEAIGFYQNRLFLAKGYELWSSKINEFWDFYEPVDLSKDDPVNISLLSYRVNDIKSMMTTRSFFVFTTGGEFGIASDGALSQDDKYLKQFSSHGINECNPILVGNIVLFVDSSGNTVRAFQYSFENDTYEANDMSVFIEEKLKGKQIITTEYLKNNKECLFLDSDGIVWVFKFFPEQNIMAWSHWKHAKYRITNLCVAPHGAYENLFVVVSTPNGKFIEKLSDNLYYDSVQSFVSDNEMTEVQTTFIEGDKIVIDDGVHKYNHVTGQNGLVSLLSPAKSVSVGIPYISEATLLSPVISTKDVGYTTYNRKKPFKAHFCFSNSYGFKVGIKEEEKLSVDFHLPSDPIDNATTLTSGKKSVLIPSKYDGSAMVSFIQEEPYPMQIENIMLEVDYAGK